MYRVFPEIHHGDTEGTEVHREKGDGRPQRKILNRKGAKKTQRPHGVRVFLCSLCVKPFLRGIKRRLVPDEDWHWVLPGTNVHKGCAGPPVDRGN